MGIGFDLTGADKVRGHKLRPASVRPNTANGPVITHGEVNVSIDGLPGGGGRRDTGNSFGNCSASGQTLRNYSNIVRKLLLLHRHFGSSHFGAKIEDHFVAHDSNWPVVHDKAPQHAFLVTEKFPNGMYAIGHAQSKTNREKANVWLASTCFPNLFAEKKRLIRCC